MPKSVSADFEKAWARPYRYVAWSVEYKRRYWNGSAYVLEAAARTLQNYEITNVAPIIINLEEANGGDILTSTSAIYIRNSWRSQRWLATNRIDSIWAPDATATLGYEPIGSQFVIKYGYRLASGDFETVALFTGYVDKPPRCSSDAGDVEIRLTGGEVLLQGKSAQDVSTAFTDQTATGTIDGTNATFETDYSVWDFSVKVGGVAKTQGVHYDVQYLNDYENKAAVVFRAGHIPQVTSPPSTVTWTGRQWKRDQSISTLIGLFCDLAGIGSAARTIEEPEWPVSAVEFHVDTQAEMEAQTLVDVDTKTQAGSMQGFTLDDFDDGELSTPNWVTTAGSGYSVSGGKLISSSPSGYISLLYSSTGRGVAIQTGSFQFLARLISGQVTLWPWRRTLFAPGGGGGPQGMGVRVTSTAIQIVEEVAGAVNVLATAAFTPGASGDVIQVAFSGTTSLEVRTGAITLNGTFSGGGPAPFASQEFWFEATGSAELDDLAYTVETNLNNAFTATHATAETAEQDLTATPSSWGTFSADVVNNGGSVEFILRVADVAGGPYTDTVVTPGAVPTAPLKRYAKLKTRWLMAAGGRVTPKVTRAQVTANLTALNLVHADFSGLDSWEAVKQLAAGPGMDVYFDASGHFYFINKRDASTPDFTLDENNAVQGIDNVDTGEEDVRNLVQVRHGTYYAEWSSVLAGETAPTSQDKYGDKTLKVDLAKFPFTASVTGNVTQGLAQLRFDQKYRARRLVTARGRIIPHMDPLDVATVSYRHTPLLKDVIFGDEMQVRPPFGSDEKGPSNVLLQRMPGKVVGLAMDVMKKTQKTIFLEVLA